MPNFQASLFDTVTNNMAITLGTECDILTITDKSNYIASTENTHELVDFNEYRQLEIKHPNGTTYNYDAHDNLDGSWNAPNGGNHAIAHTLAEAAGDGVYNVTLFAAPTWKTGETYTHSNSSPECVYYLGKLYRSLASGASKEPDTETAYWEEITREDLSAKYRTTETFALTCRKLTRCYERLVHEANCVIVDDLCNDNMLCSNRKFLEATKLRMLIDGISYAAKNSDWKRVEIIANAANKICSC